MEPVQSTPDNYEIVELKTSGKKIENQVSVENLENRAKITMCHFMIAYHKWK